MRKRTSPASLAAADRHAVRVMELRRAVFDSDAVTNRATRAAAADGARSVPPQMASYLEKVRGESYRISDAEILALRAAGHSQDEIFELTVAAALGAALRSLDCGLRTVRGAD